MSSRLPFVRQSGLGGVVGVPTVEDEPYCPHCNATRALTYTAQTMKAIAIEGFGEAAA
jgi:hypothetical protein